MNNIPNQTTADPILWIGIILGGLFVAGLFLREQTSYDVVFKVDCAGQPFLTSETGREYVDRLKREYHDAKTFQRATGSFIWANLCNPTDEQSKRHKRLVQQAEAEMGVNEQ